jgi:phosphate transport system substrate-binding protein
VLITRTGVLAGLAVGVIALTACGSSSSKSTDSTTTPAAGGSSSSTTSAATTSAFTCAKGTLNADGSTAQANAMTQWTKDFQTKCGGATVNYSGGGSGQGVTDFKSGKVDFAGSDSALDPKKNEVADATKQCGSPALDLPMVVGPIGVAFKVKGVSDLTLTPKLIAQIFLGKITKWDDPAIKAANSSATLPSTTITVFYRSDQSGTTQNFEKYLAANDPTDFTATPSKVWSGKVGQGKSGSQGVQQGISGTEGSIGYIEYSFAVNGNLDTAKVDNGGGAIELNADTAAAAAGAATVVGTGDDLSLKLDYATHAAGAYPIVLVTYEIVCTKYSDAAKGSLVKSFLSYTSGTDGQKSLTDLGYAPLPSELLGKVQASIAKIS